MYSLNTFQMLKNLWFRYAAILLTVLTTAAAQTVPKKTLTLGGAERGSLANGIVFVDMNSAQGEEALGGMKVDVKGKLYLSGPGDCQEDAGTASSLATSCP